MKNYLLIILGVASVAGLQMKLSEDLVSESGTVAALTLPLDVQTSKIAYETATFGLG
ncbi:MAG: hypothetical protein ACKVHP_19280 [Verrucomicrobiales bacterium]|jgi:hypothetical protein